MTLDGLFMLLTITIIFLFFDNVVIIIMVSSVTTADELCTQDTADCRENFPDCFRDLKPDEKPENPKEKLAELLVNITTCAQENGITPNNVTIEDFPSTLLFIFGLGRSEITNETRILPMMLWGSEDLPSHRLHLLLSHITSVFLILSRSQAPEASGTPPEDPREGTQALQGTRFQVHPAARGHRGEGLCDGREMPHGEDRGGRSYCIYVLW